MPVEIKDYPSNSDKSKELGRTDYAKPNIKGKVSVKKTSEASRKLQESSHEIGEYAIREVLIPGLKNALWDIATTSLNILLYGEASSGRRSSGAPFTSSINYASTNNINKLNRRSDPRRSNVKRTSMRPEEEIIFERKSDADMVLDQMREAIQSFGTVSVQSLFDMCDKTAPWTANKYGWMDLEDAYVDRTREGYILRLPRSLPLD
jgi:hypothetical protein